MGFGAIITSGEKNKLLPDSLVDCITEVRVEQYLDDPTQFAIRFQEDIVNGKPMIMEAPELQCEQMIAIAVKVGNALKCLVRGPITEVKCSITWGGAGSWYEIRGQDRRIEMDRCCIRRAWTGRASEVAIAIISKLFEADVAKTNLIYGSPRIGENPATQTLNQRSTDAAFISQIACQNNQHWWIEYDCQVDPLDISGKSLKIKEKAHLKPSPPRPKGSLNPPSSPANLVKLMPTVALKLRVNVKEAKSRNVTAFDLDMDTEQPNRFTGTAINERDLQDDTTFTTDPQPAINKDGQTLKACQAKRDVCVTTAGNQTEMQNRAESALTRAGWYIHATASTTAFMLGGILIPHDVVEVEGLSKMHNGSYQVESTTHVINAADHFMDLQLRRNARGG